jgi:hypothetical protein
MISRRASANAVSEESEGIATGEPRPEAASTLWIDHLVELHVLAEHGDEVSAAAAARWIAVDAHAREVWDHLGQVRDRVGSGAAPAVGNDRPAGSFG